MQEQTYEKVVSPPQEGNLDEASEFEAYSSIQSTLRKREQQVDDLSKRNYFL